MPNMKKIFVFIIIAVLRFTFGVSHAQGQPEQWFFTSGAGLPTLTANTERVIVAPYNKTVSTGQHNLGSSNNSTWRTLINFGNQWRFMGRAGYVDTIQISIDDESKVLGFRLIAVKPWEDGTYTIADRSNDVASIITANGLQKIGFSHSPYYEEGFYYGLEILTSDTTALSQNTGVSNVSLLVKDGLATSDSVEVGSWSTRSGCCVNINLYTRAPLAVVVGDSRVSGSSDSKYVHFSYLETSSQEHIYCSLSYKLFNKYGYNYFNMGHGGDGVQELLNRWYTDVTAKKPKLVFILVDVNNLAGGATYSYITTRYAQMIDSCVVNGSVPFAILKVGWTNGTTAQMRTKDSVDAFVTSYISGKGYVVDGSGTAQFRAGGDVGNKWDLTTVSNCGDGVHESNAGYHIIGDAGHTVLESNYNVIIPTLTYYQSVLDTLRNKYYIEPSYERMLMNDSLIMNATNDGWWSKMRCFTMLAANDTNVMLLDWVRKTKNNAAGNTFQIDRGTQSNGSSTYLNTFYNPMLDTPTVGQNNLSFGLYTRSTNVGSTWDMGVKSGSNYSILLCQFGGASTYWAVNQASLNSAGSTLKGLFATNRLVSDSADVLRNGSHIPGNHTDVVSSGLVNGYFFLGAYNNGGTAASFTARRYSFYYISKGLTSTDISNMYSRIYTYLLRIGAQ